MPRTLWPLAPDPSPLGQLVAGGAVPSEPLVGVVRRAVLPPPPSYAERSTFKVAPLPCPCLRLSPSQLFRACSTAFLAFSLSRSAFFYSACMRRMSFLASLHAFSSSHCAFRNSACFINSSRSFATASFLAALATIAAM